MNIHCLTLIENKKKRKAFFLVMRTQDFLSYLSYITYYIIDSINHIVLYMPGARS